MADSILLDPTKLLPLCDPERRLNQYFDLLMQENRNINLVSRETSRKTFDSLASEALLPPHHLDLRAGSYLDIGSGGGLPAIPILLSGRIAGSTVLVERTQKKAAALGRIASGLGLSVEILDRAFEELRFNRTFDLITLSYVKLSHRLLTFILKDLSPGGLFVYYSSPSFSPQQCRYERYSFTIEGDTAVRTFTVFRRN